MSIPEEINALAALAEADARQVRHFLFVSADNDYAEGGGPAAVDPVFTINVPAGRCLVLLRFDVDSYPVSGGVDLYAHRQRNNFNEGVQIFVESNDVPIARETTEPRYYAGEVFYVFPASAKITFSVTIPAGGDRMKVSYRLHGYLLPARHFEVLAALQTIIRN